MQATVQHSPAPLPPACRALQPHCIQTMPTALTHPANHTSLHTTPSTPHPSHLVLHHLLRHHLVNGASTCTCMSCAPGQLLHWTALCSCAPPTTCHRPACLVLLIKQERPVIICSSPSTKAMHAAQCSAVHVMSVCVGCTRAAMQLSRLTARPAHATVHTLSELPRHRTQALPLQTWPRPLLGHEVVGIVQQRPHVIQQPCTWRQGRGGARDSRRSSPCPTSSPCP